MRSAVLTTLALVLVACSGARGSQPDTGSPKVTVTPPSNQTPPAVATAPATPIPLINVDDMLGMYPQQTVFVATSDHVSAITLLNHFTRYQLATRGVAEVSADRSGRWLYVLDADAPGSRRLRIFDVPSGGQRGLQAAIPDVAEGGHALGVAIDGRVLVLKSDASHAWVDAYQANTLQPSGTVMQGPACSDRMLTSAGRIAIVCASSGEVAVDEARGTSAVVERALPDLVAATMAEDGTLYLATADEHVATVGAGASKLVNIAWPSEWSGTILADGLAVAQGGTSVLIAQTNDDSAWLRVADVTDGSQRKSLRLAGVPHGGVLAMWPFAYYAVGSTIRHVDLTSGLLETMAAVGSGAVPSAVVNG